MIIKAFDISDRLGIRGALTHRQNGIVGMKHVLSLADHQTDVGAAIEIDFSGINTFDVAFLDEFIPGLILRFRKTLGRILFVSNLDKELYFALECVLAHRELKRDEHITLLRKHGDDFSLCGSRLEPNLIAAMKITLRCGKVTTRMIADELGIPVNNASTRMKRLFDLRLVGRYTDIDTAGKLHYYILPRS